MKTPGLKFNIAAFCLLAFAVAGCSGVPVPADEASVAPGVTTFCDRGHRLYLYSGGYAGGLAVVPNGCAQDAK